MPFQDPIGNFIVSFSFIFFNFLLFMFLNPFNSVSVLVTHLFVIPLVQISPRSLFQQWKVIMIYVCQTLLYQDIVK